MPRTKEQRKVYEKENHERIYAKQKEYKAAHRAKIVEWQKEYHKKYYEENRDAIRAAAKEYKERTRKDPRYAAKRMLVFARFRAKRDGLPFNLTLDDIVIPDVCPVFGVPFVFGAKGNHPYSPSLDKLIPELGYVKGNIRVISYRANTLKRDASFNEIARLYRWMRKNNTNSEDVPDESNFKASNKFGLIKFPLIDSKAEMANEAEAKAR